MLGIKIVLVISALNLLFVFTEVGINVFGSAF